VKEMKITIDRDGCIECGACTTTCPAVFELKENEKASIISQYRSGGSDKGEVGPDLNSCAKDAADSCPVAVIHTD
jgi:ferredoxin